MSDEPVSEPEPAPPPAPAPEDPPAPSVPVDPLQLDVLTAHVYSDLHATPPAVAAAGMPADSALSKLVSLLGLTEEDLATIKDLGIRAVRLVVKIALAKFGLSALGR